MEKNNKKKKEKQNSNNNIPSIMDVSPSGIFNGMQSYDKKERRK